MKAKAKIEPKAQPNIEILGKLKEMEDQMLKNHLKVEKKIEEEELRVTDWDTLRGFVASGVEPRGINLVENFYEDYKKIYDKEIDNKGYFLIIKRSPLYICKK